MKVTKAQMRRAMLEMMRQERETEAEMMLALINAVLADPEVRAQILREETGGGQSSLFGGSRG
jgi:hypothetical protein